MYFFDGNMNIEQHDKCHKESSTKENEIFRVPKSGYKIPRSA